MPTYHEERVATLRVLYRIAIGVWLIALILSMILSVYTISDHLVAGMWILTVWYGICGAFVYGDYKNYTQTFGG